MRWPKPTTLFHFETSTFFLRVNFYVSVKCFLRMKWWSKNGWSIWAIIAKKNSAWPIALGVNSKCVINESINKGCNLNQSSNLEQRSSHVWLNRCSDSHKLIVTIRITSVDCFAFVIITMYIFSIRKALPKSCDAIRWQRLFLTDIKHDVIIFTFTKRFVEWRKSGTKNCMSAFIFGGQIKKKIKHMFVSCLVRLVFTFKIRFRRVVHVRAQFFVCIKRPMQIVYNTRYFHRRARYKILSGFSHGKGEKNVKITNKVICLAKKWLLN